MQKTLTELLHDLEHEMLRLGYTKKSMNFYRSRWQMLLQFAQKRGEIYYSERLGIDFIEECFHILEKNFNKNLFQAETQELRIIRVIGDFQLHHTILRQHYKYKSILTEPYFIGISSQFMLYCKNKGYAKCTTDYRVKQSERFMYYLSAQNIMDCKTINLTLIHNYLKTLAGYTDKTIEQNISALRIFLRYIFEQAKVDTDFATKIPMVRVNKQTTIPSVWTEAELKTLIATIDRGSPKGKRDYAIILLACRLGIRCTDIKKLKREHFHWGEKQLVFIQSKTKVPISLPLTPDVGWAIIDYLKYGRPKIDNPYIFIRHRAPFGPFAEDNHLHTLIKRYMEQAHLPILNKKRGMHSLRHTMASILLEKDTPLTTISNILGHVDTESTAVYLKVNIKKLKECALELDEETDYE